MQVYEFMAPVWVIMWRGKKSI